MKTTRKLWSLSALLVLGLGEPMRADFTLVEDFQSHVTGSDVDTAHGWVSSGDTVAVVVADPIIPDNKTLHRIGNGGASKSGAPINIPQGAAPVFPRS